MLLNDYPHQQHVEYEQDRGEVQVVDVVQCRDYVTQTELENEVQYNVNRDDDLSSDSRNLLPEEAAQQANKDRGVERSESRVTKLVMPPMYSMNGDMMVETTATTVPKFWPILTMRASDAVGLNSGR